MRTKFSKGDDVAYKPRVSPSIEMRETRIVGFDCKKEFKWKVQRCDITKERRNKRTATGQVESRYVIEHYFGWYPSTQKDLNPELCLDETKRYYFAYESELRFNK